MKRTLTILFSLLLSLVFLTPAQSAVRNLATNIVYPDLQAALNGLPASFSSSIVLEAQDSTPYICTPNVGLIVPAFASNGFTLTIRAATGLRPRIDGNGGNIAVTIANGENIIFEGFEFANISKTDVAGAILRINNNSRNITIRNVVFRSGYTAARVTLINDRITFDRCVFEDLRYGSVRADNFTNLTIKGCRINMYQADSTSAGACRVVGGKGFVFEDNEVSDVWNSTEMLSMILVDSVFIRRSTFHHSTGSAIYLRGVETASGNPMQQCVNINISENLFHNIGVSGINFSTVKDVFIRNNTFILDSDASAIFIFKENDNIQYHNNIFHDRYTGAVSPRAAVDIRTLLNVPPTYIQDDYNLYDLSASRLIHHEEFPGTIANYVDLNILRAVRTFRAANSKDTLVLFNAGALPSEPYFMVQGFSQAVNAGSWQYSDLLDLRGRVKQLAQTDIGCYTRQAIQNTATAAPQAQFGAVGSRLATIGSMVTSVTLRDSTPQSVVSRFWSIDPPLFQFVNNTNQHSIQPEVEFTQEGLYAVKLVVYNGLGTDTLAKTSYIDVRLGFCMSAPALTNGYKMDSISINQVAYGKAALACAGFTDRSADTILVARAVPFPFRIKPGNCVTFTGPSKLMVLADLNHDGFLDEVIERLLVDSFQNANAKNWNLVLPDLTPQGPMRMRIILYNANSIQTPQACGTYSDGETFDITLQVVNPTGAVMLPLSSQCIQAGPTFLTNGYPVGGTYSGPGVTAQQFNPIVAGSGTHTIQYTVTYNAQVWTTSTTITVYQQPQVNLPALGPFCSRDATVQLNQATPPGGTYLINGVPATSFAPTAAIGQFQLTYLFSDANGCVAGDTAIVVVRSSPTALIQQVQPVCQNAQPFQVSGFPSGGVFSGTGVNALGGFNPATSGAGTFPVSYVVTNQFGCSDTASTSVVIHPLPVVTLNIPAVACADQLIVNMTGGSPAGGAYQFNGNNIANFNASAAGPGNYPIVYRFSNAFGCQGQAVDTLRVVPLPSVSLVLPDTVCKNGSPVTLTGGFPLGGSYSGFGVSGNQFNPANVSVGNAVVFYQYTNSQGCTNTARDTLVVASAPALSHQPLAPFCVRSTSVMLTGGSPAGGTYSGSFVTGSTFNPAQAGVGNHTVTYRFSSSNGCVGTLSVGVFVSDTPQITWPAYAPLCASATPVNLTQAQPSGGTYTVNGVPVTQFNPSVYGPGNYNIFYSTVSVPGCTGTAVRSIQVLNVPPTPTISRTGDSLLSSSSTGNQWMLNGFNIPGATDRIYEPFNQGLYSVKVNGGTCFSLPSAIFSFFFTSQSNLSLKPVKVWPIPASSQLQVEWNWNAGFYSLIDLSGRTMLSGKLLEGVNVLDLPGMTEGIYTLQLSHEGKIENVKVQIIR